LKIYEGLGHGMCTINHERINADPFAFIKGEQTDQAAA
jgi:hypothetical protein